MKKLLCLVVLICLPYAAWAASEGVPLQKAQIDINNVQSLQRGARLFHNYCLSCHSAQYMRYKRMAADLEIPVDLVKENLMFGPAKIGDTMTIAMPAADAANWFGKAPPDLTLTARQRGADWLYTYLTSFYLDQSSPTGANNLVFKDVGMPHVLWELQGWQALAGGHDDHAQPVQGEESTHGEPSEEMFELVVPGSMTPEEYDRAVLDLVNYMAYIAEPIQAKRQRVGIFVLLFLAIFGVFAYALKHEYWRDVH
ncbi:MAG: cytochrome c1 [Pseudomonadota bacterium]|nr:cytochrome c1 [Pseudomonadota bacterium]